ncbi:MAG: GTPase Era [Armatimonadetes bacterium]|nr:GTPase Era [Armatimonadota bacterium]
MPEEKTGEFHSGFVLLWGRPNVGKSTLLNTALGRKLAIVTAKPQTTRNRIAGVRTTDASQMVFVDTPGIHAPHDLLGQYMLSTAREALPDADVVLFVVDASSSPRPEDEQGAHLLRAAEAPVFLVLNKADLVSPDDLHSRRRAYGRLGEFADSFAISALTGAGVPDLVRRIEQALPPGPLYYPPEMVTDHPESFLVAELIREQALLLTQQEVPYSLAVVVEEITPRSEEMTYIRAVLYVERESQKGILIGEGGKMLREIGRAARAQAEPLLKKRLYLDLWVKVRPRWRRDETVLARFGYPLPRKPRKRRRK